MNRGYLLDRDEALREYAEGYDAGQYLRRRHKEWGTYDRTVPEADSCRFGEYQDGLADGYLGRPYRPT